jgi:sigma-E factor negative regulatory protein RseC
MTESEGTVVRVDRDYLWLGVDNGCSGCDKISNCGAGESRLQRVRNTIGARIGDRIVVTVPDGAVLKAALYSYLLPVLLTLVGAAGGTSLGGDRSAVGGALVGLAGGWLALRLGGRREPLVQLRLKRNVVHLHRNESL